MNDDMNDVPPPVGEAISPEGHDLLLQVLVTTLGSKSSESFDLTLSTRGLVVEGTAVPFDVWRDLLTGQVRDAGVSDPEALEGVREAYELFWAADEQTREVMTETETYVPDVLHLVDATVVTVAGEARYPLWRVRFDRVDGWALGKSRPVQSPTISVSGL
ncbi:MAG: hypothetical protein M3Y66_06180 [Actinomycetota bacterium]|nr:hypothetical protein [Actinomycetota bacterium]